jgi:hypothetical protein
MIDTDALKRRVSLAAVIRSYGVELNRSMSESTYQHMASDPVLNDFVWRYMVHYALVKP